MNFLWGWSYKPQFESRVFTLCPSGWKAHSSSLVLTCPHSHTWHQALCMCVCVCVCVCVCACTHACTLSHIWYFVTPLAVACQTPLSMEFSRQEYWNKWSFPSPVDHPNPGIKPTLLCLLLWQAGSLPAEPQGSPCKRQWLHLNMWAQSDLTASRSSYDAETSLICMRTVLYKIPRKKYFPYSCTSFVWGALVISGPWTAPTNLDYSAYSDHVWVT